MKRSILLLCALLAACDVGNVTLQNNPGSPDGGTMMGSDAGSGSGGCVNGETAGNYSPAHPHTAPVNPADPYNMGQNCMQANCHGIPQGAGAPQYFAGGTVYTDATGTTGAAGAYIMLGSQHTYADDHGNFYFTSPVTFPVAAGMTTANAVCPTVSAMVEGVAVGSCTGNACHGTVNGTLQLGGYVHI